MIKKTFRLNRHLLNKVLIKGQTVRGDGFILKSLSNYEKFSRYAVSISSKSCKSAVIRNFLKRKLLNNSPVKLNSTKDLLIIIKSKIDKNNYEEIYTNLNKALSEISLV